MKVMGKIQVREFVKAAWGIFYEFLAHPERVCLKIMGVSVSDLSKMLHLQHEPCDTLCKEPIISSSVIFCGVLHIKLS